MLIIISHFVYESNSELELGVVLLEFDEYPAKNAIKTALYKRFKKVHTLEYFNILFYDYRISFLGYYSSKSFLYRPS